MMLRNNLFPLGVHGWCCVLRVVKSSCSSHLGQDRLRGMKRGNETPKCRWWMLRSNYVSASFSTVWVYTPVDTFSLFSLSKVIHLAISSSSSHKHSLIKWKYWWVQNSLGTWERLDYLESLISMFSAF